ncbi:DNA-processing protein DprA, partial [Actinotalea sp. JY-7885]
LRWAGRLDGLDVERDLRHAQRLGVTVLVPGAAGWPSGLDDLGAAAPACLWVRGTSDLARLCARSVALIGARACTAYGEHVTAQVASGVADAGWTVVSGGAYGIDAVAHRVALASAAPTVAFLAGGVDRPYPAGNARLLAAMADGGGAVVSEVPPGSVPSRSRFLLRNRLIAGAARATVVLEAAWRSGALSTAGHAAGLLRPVGAVPGPVTSAASAGCHRLLRDGLAVCVTDAAEVLELAGGLDAARAGAPPGGRSDARPGAARDRHARLDLGGLDDAARRTLDALPVRQGARLDALARVAGLSGPEVAGALGALELAGLATEVTGGWRRADRPGPGRTGAIRTEDWDLPAQGG